MTAGMPTLSQIGLCASDLPQAKRFYIEVLGFQDAGAKLLCGERVGQIQELGENASFIMNWMVGRQEFVQIEMFQHILPRQRPLPRDWRVSDIGWNRFGLAVADFDACLIRLEQAGVELVAGPMNIDKRRRCSFRDPFIGSLVEIIDDERSASKTDGKSSPAWVNVGLSVGDLARARKFWLEDLNLPEDPDFAIDQRREQLWELNSPQAEGFSLTLNGISLEITSYRTPAPRIHEGRLLSDQGIMNVALGFRDREAMVALLDRLEERGYRKSVPLGNGPITATYFRGPDNISLELFCCPKECDDRLGFVPIVEKPLFG